MSSISVNTPCDTWTKVVTNSKQGRIRVTLTNPTEYFYDVVPTGNPSPSLTMVSGSKILPNVWDFQFRGNVDIYIYAFTFDGRVDVDDDAPYIDTFVQDQHTPAVLVKFNQVHNSTTLTAEGTKNTDTITVASTTGIIIGSYIIVFNVSTGRYYVGTALSIVGSVITLDTLLDSTFPIGSIVDIAITNMNVDGSTTRQIFGLRGLGVIPGIDIEVDITRIIFHCLTSSTVNLAKFADLTKLARGLALRKRDGEIFNIFNVKSNGEIDGITLDWKPYLASNPSQGQDGFTARLTFSGQEKMGIVQRLASGEDLEFIVQDALQTITLLEVMAEGSVVE